MSKEPKQNPRLSGLMIKNYVPEYKFTHPELPFRKVQVLII
jgi:hypothetical protein